MQCFHKVLTKKNIWLSSWKILTYQRILLYIPGESKDKFTFLAGSGRKRKWLIFQNEISIYQLKPNFDGKILLKSLIFETQETSKMPFVWESAFHVPFWSMIYLELKFKFSATVSFRSRISISIASKSWTRKDREILFLIHALCTYSSNFWDLKLMCNGK